MLNIDKYEDFNESNSKFLKEHDKIIKKFNIDFIFLKGIKIPVICLYKIVDILFKKNSEKIETSNIVLLTLTATAILSKENDDVIIKLLGELTNRKIDIYLSSVKKILLTIRTVSNIILKNDGVVIKNIEQFLKYKSSIKILNLIFSYIFIFNIKIKDFSYWYKLDQPNKDFTNLIKYISINY